MAATQQARRNPGFFFALMAFEQREGRIEEVRVNSGIAIASIRIRKMVVPVSERERATLSGEDLYASAEAEGEVVLR